MMKIVAVSFVIIGLTITGFAQTGKEENMGQQNAWLKITQDTLRMSDPVEHEIILPITIKEINKEQFVAMQEKHGRTGIAARAKFLGPGGDSYFVETDSTYQIRCNNIIKTFSKEEYGYIGYMEKLHSYLLYRKVYWPYILLDDETGEETEHQSMPVLSSNGEILLYDYGDMTPGVCGVGLSADYVPNYFASMMIWKFYETGPLALAMFRYMTHEWIPVKAVWENNANLLLEVIPIIPGKKLSTDEGNNRFIQIQFSKEIKAN